MTAQKSPQTMKPETAAKKLGIYLPAAPAEFHGVDVTRAELNALLESPPEWLVELRLNGPHPRQEVARKLGISISGLTRAGVDDPFTTAEIKALLAAPPEWLVVERARQAGVHEENARIKTERAEKLAAKERAERHARTNPNAVAPKSPAAAKKKR
ncbi:MULTISPECIES: DUF5997 family protein [Subtercola]|uniref:Uncharacterized protein n=1 Tax=Subtercola vilae TaxID=2056433 RepID=A0A4T2C5M7_9MICO|nr:MULTISPECIES: DUF5997 family protein [Subtercola]MEA9985432.1 DUF5997 family protein [Subtercola sp. RTI3]TIH39447.1 hypothetical protein D4765_04500 [Subtercola vilae]